MTRGFGPERQYFGGEHGRITEMCAGKTKYFWKCEFCGWRAGGKSFPNSKARVHLSGDVSLRSGLISQVCDKAPADVNKEFKLLVEKKRLEKEQAARTRKRGGELLDSKIPSKQSRLRLGSPVILKDEEVDRQWAEAFFCLDVAGNKIDHPLFREAIAATKRSSPRSV